MSKKSVKQKALYFATGFMAATLLASSVTTFAAPIKKQIDAYFNNTIKLVVTNTNMDMDYSDKIQFGIVNAGFLK